MILNTSFIDNDVVAKLVNSLQLYVENNDFTGLAEKVNSTTDIMQSLTKISADTMQAEINAVKVDLSLTNPDLADTAAKVILGYLNNNSYIKSIIEKRSEQREFLISTSRKKAGEIDSLLNNTRITTANFNDISTLRKIYTKLVRDIQEGELESSMFNHIDIIEQNIILVSGRSMKNTLIVNLITYLFLGFILSAIIDIIRRYIRYQKQIRKAGQDVQ